MSTTPTTPRTKPQPVVLLGAVIAGITATISTLTVLLKDNPTAVLALGVVGAVTAGVSLAKDRYVRDSVVPLQDTAQYVNEQGQTVAGPASPLQDGTIIDSTLVATGQISAGVVDVGRITAESLEGDGAFGDNYGDTFQGR